jgi:hypothetical protein
VAHGSLVYLRVNATEKLHRRSLKAYKSRITTHNSQPHQFYAPGQGTRPQRRTYLQSRAMKAPAQCFRASWMNKPAFIGFYYL